MCFSLKTKMLNPLPPFQNGSICRLIPLIFFMEKGLSFWNSQFKTYTKTECFCRFVLEKKILNTKRRGICFSVVSPFFFETKPSYPLVCYKLFPWRWFSHKKDLKTSGSKNKTTMIKWKASEITRKKMLNNKEFNAEQIG